jgi:hypothetical protein
VACGACWEGAIRVDERFATEEGLPSNVLESGGLAEEVPASEAELATADALGDDALTDPAPTPVRRLLAPAVRQVTAPRRVLTYLLDGTPRRAGRRQDPVAWLSDPSDDPEGLAWGWGQ